MITDERRLEQTRWAWINEYGPAQAESLLKAVDDLRATQPQLALQDVIARIDPETEADYDGFCASRW
ncbi:MAG: hypothetical protein IT196_00880 [Acidimicrobiales bacterium]|nr:hypothetical protein [Acidimicrobiales bacterium]